MSGRKDKGHAKNLNLSIPTAPSLEYTMNYIIYQYKEEIKRMDWTVYGAKRFNQTPGRES